MADIVYTYEGKVYLNLTNICPCRCKFCIRNNGDSVGEAKLLWHEKQPTIDEIIEAVDSFNYSKECEEVVICGYGEPTAQVEILKQTCVHIKEKFGFKIRLNTNGLGNLINKRDITEEVCSVIDSISISLNAPTAEKYNDIVQPQFGMVSFSEMLSFAEKCKKHLEDVHFSVVDVISKEDIEECKKLAEKMGIPLRVREYTA